MIKRSWLISVLFINFFALQVTAQCNETYNLCLKQLSKEDKKAGWFTNKQSQSVSYQKGEIYETSLTAFKGFEYRLTVCVDADGGMPATFQLSQDVMVTVNDSDGNAKIERQRKIIFDNTADTEELYVLFRGTNKTEKFYLTVNVPANGKSATKKLKNTENVCVGVLLEHRKAKKSAF